MDTINPEVTARAAALRVVLGKVGEVRRDQSGNRIPRILGLRCISAANHRRP